MVKGISGNFFNIIIRCEGKKKGYGMAKNFLRILADFHISCFEIAVLTP
jgi:hypothetical protein